MILNKKCPYSKMPIKPEHNFMFIGHCSAAHRDKTKKRVLGGFAALAVFVIIASQL